MSLSRERLAYVYNTKLCYQLKKDGTIIKAEKDTRKDKRPYLITTTTLSSLFDIKVKDDVFYINESRSVDDDDSSLYKEEKNPVFQRKT